MNSFVPLPDIVTFDKTDKPLPLKWVGMEGLALPMSFMPSNKSTLLVTAKADVYVSLDDPTSKGIHMSRLHLLVNEIAHTPINQIDFEAELNRLIQSQKGTSKSAKLNLSFDFTLTKASLLSGEHGYQAYPVRLCLQNVDGLFKVQLELTVAYSSTCPCSASLSRHAYCDAINKHFSSDQVDKAQLLAWLESQAGSIATPHSQRSFAYLKLELNEFHFALIPRLIKQTEEFLGTPVQTAVKRQDEQEFAKMNAENLMFCEDAARKIKFGLEQIKYVKDYWFKVEHQESLHAHNAVVIDQKQEER